MAGPVSVFAIERRITDESENDPTCRRLEALERGDDVDENAQGEEFAGQEEEAELREMGEEDAAYDADLRARLADISRRRSNEGATRRSWQNQGNGTRETDYAQERNNSSVVFDEDDITTLRQDGSRTMGRNVTIDEPICDSMEKTSGDATDDAPQPMSYPYQTRRRFRRISAGFSSAMTSTDRSLASFSAVVSESWDRRHDPKHKGFWDALWRWLMGAKVDANAGQQEGDPDYVPPKYRWTPILSGLLQPFSILLEIPGLTEHWYVRTENNIPVVYQENPVILDVGLAISMACGVVANVALISRFLERRVFTSTIACIVMLTCHDIINIVIVTIFGVIHDVNDGFNYSEAFWLCVCSTVASMFTNITLIYDLVKTKDFARSGSGLTPKQRKLVIIVMILLVYIALGALCFNFLLPNIAFQNALYYTVVSIETIGFGDISPSTLGAKIFLFFYVPVGILNLAVAVGTARDTLVESWSTAYRRRRHEMIKRHRLRKQQRIEENIRRMAIEKQLLMVGAPVYVSTKSGGVRGGAKGKKLNIRALSKDQLDEAENAAINEIAKQGGTGSARSAIRAVPDVGTQGYEKAVEDVRKMQDELTQQSLLSEEGYREFQEKLAHEEKMENLFKFAFAFGLFLVFWVVGATIFSQTEEWAWFTGLYFCFVTFTTIGYGDVSPLSPAGRAFFIIWAILGVATVTLLIAVLTEAYANRYKSALIQKSARRAMTAIKEQWDKAAAVGETMEDIDRERVERLPYEIIDLMTVWHQHVAAARHGAFDGHDDDKLKELLNTVLEEQGLTEQQKRELLGDPESRKLLFWNGYERAIHRLISVAESAIHIHQKTRANLSLLTKVSSMTADTPTPARLGRRFTRTSTLNTGGLAWSPVALDAPGGAAWNGETELVESPRWAAGEG